MRNHWAAKQTDRIGDVHLYVDGARIERLMGTEGHLVDTRGGGRTGFALGDDPSADRGALEGALDDVAFFGAALTDAQVREVYEQALAGSSVAEVAADWRAAQD